MTTNTDRAAAIEAFLAREDVQRKIADTIRNINEIYAADKLGLTRREARAALKLTGQGGW